MTIKELNDEKKEYLKEYIRKTRKIESLEEQKKSIIELAKSAKAVGYDDMPHAHKETDLSDYMVRLENITERIDELKKELYSILADIEEQIMKMKDGNESKVLHKKYIEFKDWEQIAEEIDKSLRHVYRIHEKALSNFEMKTV